MTEQSRILPLHLAVIMDGNGRWAKQRGLGREAGHKAGAEAVRTLLTESRKLGIRYVTVYAFSKENWQRPKAEVDYLFNLFARFIKREVATMLKHGIRLNMIGEKSDLSLKTRTLLDKAMADTAHCREQIFTVALSYSGREEILRAVRKALSQGLVAEELTEDFFRQSLYDPDLPDPDLLIRTSGEIRISNFLLFQCAYSELYFSPTMWPDFSKQDLDLALQSFSERKRRFGLTSEQVENRED